MKRSKFQAPDWANVYPAPIPPPSTGNPKADAALAALFGGKDDKALKTAAANAGEDALIRLFDGPVLTAGSTYWDDDKVGKLKGPSDKRAQKSAYDRAETAKADRARLHLWFAVELAKTARGRDRLLEVAAGDHAPTVRASIAQVLRDAKPDAAFQKRAAAAIDPRTWVGGDSFDDSTYLMRTYCYGAECAIQTDAESALRELAPLLAAPGTAKRGQASYAATAVLWAVKNAAASVDGAELAGWTPHVLPLIANAELEHPAKFALAVLPPDPSMIAPVLATLGTSPDKVVYWDDHAVKILGRVADQRCIPWLAVALTKSWTHWPAVFEGFANAGDPAAIPIIEAWLATNGAPDRVKGAAPVLAKLRKLAGSAKPTPDQKAAATELLATPEPVPVRPVLTFQKAGKPPKIALESAAKQRTEHGKLLAAAKLDKYAALLRAAVVFGPTRVKDADLAIGTSKLGGHPDLPAKLEWPRAGKRPLTFLGQLDLAFASKHLPPKTLPAKATSGLLSIFLADDPLHDNYLGDVAVLHIPAKTKLERRELPADFTSKIYQACKLAPHAAWWLPNATDWHAAKMTKAERERYEAEVYTAPESLPQLLGYRAHGWEGSVKKGETLLFQFPSEGQSDMEFGDADTVALFIDEKRLAKGDFSKVRVQVGD